MSYRIELEAEVGADGKVHLEVDVPDAQPGQKVQVVLKNSWDPSRPARVFGQFRGRIHILPGFDDPIPGFE